MTKLTDLTIAEARDGLRDKSFSARELTQTHTEAIEAANAALNTFVLPTPERALEMAAASDARRNQGQAGALEGIPLGVSLPSVSSNRNSWNGPGRRNVALMASGNRLFSNNPLTRSSNCQPRSAIMTPAGSLLVNIAPLAVAVPFSSCHFSVPSLPMMRISLPIQLLMADGVSVQKLVQPISPFSREPGGKNAPALTDQDKGPVGTGR